VDMIKNDEIEPHRQYDGREAGGTESNSIRREAVHRRVTYYTTLARGSQLARPWIMSMT